MEFRILGSVEVADDRGELVALGPRRHVEVLALLLTRRNSVVPADQIADLLWEGEPPATAAVTLQGYVAHLRKALEPGRPARTPARVLVTRGPGYALDVPDEQVDAARFLRAVEQGRKALADADPEQVVALLRPALALWRGPAFGELASAGWATPDAIRLDEARLAATEDLAEARLALGDHAAVAAELRASVGEFPLRERLRGLLILALYRSGRQAEALEVAREGRERLAEELGIDPGPELQRLEAAVLRQDPSLELPPTPAEPPAVAARRAARPTSAGAPNSRSSAAPSFPLLGRRSELSALTRSYAAAAAGQVSYALVAGEPGIGKTRLVEEFARSLPDAAVAVGRCTESVGAPPYWPWRQILAAIGPGAELPMPVEAADANRARFDLALAVAEALRILARERPVVLVLEDVHWADVGSLQLLDVLVGELTEARLLVVLTFRDGLAPDHPLRRSLGVLARRPSLLRLDLSGLEPDDVVRQVTQVAGREPAETAGTAIVARSGGNPFFVQELARLLDEQGRLAERLPSGVRDVVRLRLSALPPAAEGLLGAGAVLGRDFGFEMARAAAGLDRADALDGLDAALGAGLLSEPAPGRLRFAHALVTEAVLEDLGRARRARLHQAAADALRRRSAGGVPASVLARHLVEAGAPDAAEACARAAREALETLALEPALEFADHGLDHLDDLPPDRQAEVQRELLLVRGTALHRAGRLDEGAAALTAAAESARADGDAEALARTVVAATPTGSLAGYWSLFATTDPAVSGRATEALDLLGSTGTPLRVAVESTLAATLALAGDPRAEALSQEVYAAEVSDPRIRARALAARWCALWTPQHAVDRARLVEEMLQLAADPATELAARHLRCLVLLERGDIAGSDREVAALRDRVRELRDPDFALVLAWWDAMRALVRGDLVEAERMGAEVFGKHLEVGEANGVSSTAARVAAESVNTIRGIVAWERGQLGALLPMLTALPPGVHVGWAAVTALALAQGGRSDEALATIRDRFGPELEAVPEGPAGVSPLVLLAEVLALAPDPTLAAVLLPRLEPMAEAVIVFAPGAVCMGAGSLYTGTAAWVAGSRARAARDLADALARNDELGARPFADRARRRLEALRGAN